MKKTTPRKVTLRKSKTDEIDYTDHTDYERLAAMTDEDIDFSDNPEAAPEMLARGVLRRNFKVVPRQKELIIIVDSDLLWWYQKQGPGYQTLITSLLRAHMEEQLRKTKSDGNGEDNEL